MHINNTAEYHRSHLVTLGWELTVCNSLVDEKSPCRRVLCNPQPFGEALFYHLQKFVPLHSIVRVVEIGGGYGNLMADFLRLQGKLKPTMIDISPEMQIRQKDILAGNNVEFILSDFFDIPTESLDFFELAILNENLGDFPTACNIAAEVLFNNKSDELIKTIKSDFEKYKFTIPTVKYFNYNIGAIRAVEKLCGAKIPFIYLSEHSCERRLQHENGMYSSFYVDEYPYPIHLYGHTEYTIKFSHLVAVAKYYGYKVHRGCFEDFLKIKWTDEIRFIINTNSTKDEHEVVRQFIEDLFIYEYLVLIRQ